MHEGLSSFHVRVELALRAASTAAWCSCMAAQGVVKLRRSMMQAKEHAMGSQQCERLCMISALHVYH